jgi:hypothetical protein
MTAHRAPRRIIGERQQKTHESYMAARAHVLRDRAALLGLDADPPATVGPLRVDAVVLKVTPAHASYSWVASSRTSPSSSKVNVMRFGRQQTAQCSVNCCRRPPAGSTTVSFSSPQNAHSYVPVTA